MISELKMRVGCVAVVVQVALGCGCSTSDNSATDRQADATSEADNEADADADAQEPFDCVATCLEVVRKLEQDILKYDPSMADRADVSEESCGVLCQYPNEDVKKGLDCVYSVETRAGSWIGAWYAYDEPLRECLRKYVDKSFNYCDSDNPCLCVDSIQCSWKNSYICVCKTDALDEDISPPSLRTLCKEGKCGERPSERPNNEVCPALCAQYGWQWVHD